MKIITVATKSDGYMPLLLESCKRNNLDLVVLGWEQKWQGFTWRIKLMKEYLIEIDPEELVVFIDAYDVFNIRDEESICKQFAKFEKDIVISSEFQTSLLSDYFFKRIFGSPCRSHKINAGMYAGKASALLEFYEEVNKFSLNGTEVDDQKLFMRCCGNSHFFQNRVAVDAEGFLFLNINAGNENPQSAHLYRVDRHKIIVNRSGLEPCFIHGPGNVNLDAIAQIYQFKSKRHPPRQEYAMNFFKTHLKSFQTECIIICILILLLILATIFLLKKREIANSEDFVEEGNNMDLKKMK